jgi:hypothetical protein
MQSHSASGLYGRAKAAGKIQDILAQSTQPIRICAHERHCCVVRRNGMSFFPNRLDRYEEGHDQLLDLTCLLPSHTQI